MLPPATCHWRKCSDINRDYAIFEMLVGEEILLGAGFDDKRTYEINLFDNLAGKTIELRHLLSLLEESRSIAAQDI